MTIRDSGYNTGEYRTIVLLDSSDKTCRWLSYIKKELEKKITNVSYKEGKYWASFRSPDTHRNFTYLHPTKNQIRVFTRIPIENNEEMQLTPASKNWAEMYPSIYTIRNEIEIQTAIGIIYKSYRFDLLL